VPELTPGGLPFRAYHQARATAAWVNRRIDKPSVLPPLPAPPPSTTYLIYRRRNTSVVAALVAQAEAAGGVVHLWALDEVAPDLAAWTRGSGPDPKFPLLAKLIDGFPPRDGDVVVVSDDDLAFRRGSIGSFLAVMNAAALDLAMPAHSGRYNVGHVLTISKPRTVARVTAFVEIGPLFAVSPALRDRWRHDLDDVRMGWGLEARWSAYRADGFRLGIVDAVTFRHLGKIGTAYDVDAAFAERDRLFAEAGVSGMEELFVTENRWPRGEDVAPWLVP
jgi:hypothetical protein